MQSTRYARRIRSHRQRLSETDQPLFAGGEFYADDRWTTDAPTISTGDMLFLAGGQACLTVIGDYLRDHGIERVLLPAYLCPTIVTVFERCGLACDFYQVHEDLSIDLDDLAGKVVPRQAVYWINYFGFFPSQTTIDFLQDLRQNGVLLIEDNAQAGFHDHPNGDFILNSLRKLTAHDGGYLISRYDLAPTLQRYQGRPNRRLAVIREYRRRLSRYLFQGEGDHSELEALFHQAEEYYRTDLAIEGDPLERLAIERLDWPGIRRIRRENYQYLLGLIQSIPEITPVFPALQPDNLPLGLPVYFSGVSRDRVNDALGRVGIGLSIHWEEIASHPRTCADRQAVEMADRMLTLVIDQRTGRRQLDYLALNLVRAIEAAKP